MQVPLGRQKSNRVKANIGGAAERGFAVAAGHQNASDHASAMFLLGARHRSVRSRERILGCNYMPE
jgi:hypothetical protein